MILCSEVHKFEFSNRASDSSDLILTTNDREPFIAVMRSEPSDARSDGLKLRSIAAQHCPPIQKYSYCTPKCDAH
ncbi:hypothetical protein RHMOL_Rhmol02G0273400 [Rhododendron molle]|uniref:Uncharacterized protein n=1 Tax=Rhododendron molle TaxID=49168 RepID=A0ACC0PX69_RHOML|nr:hypothetical protein RHMOL_Rhmol02G0273400 [Rhododendron molle]